MIRPSLKKLVPLGSLTLQVVQLGFTTIGLLEVLTGAFIAAFQLRRRLMSCVEEAYGAQRNRGRDCVIKLSRQLKDELLVMVSLLPLSVIDMRLQPSDLLLATDASMGCEAAVSAEVGKERTMEFQRHALQKGLWNRLLSPEASYLKEAGLLESSEELPEDSYRMHPLWEEVVSCCQFQLFGKVRRVRKKRHINLGEVQASLEAERRLGRLQPSSYFVNLQDSQVSLACLVKGRSSSASLNKLLRQSVPHHVAYNVRPFYGFVRSKLNPSDDPTRSVPLRKPVRAHRPWWEDIGRGKFERFDAFLEEMGCHPMQTAGLPDERELWEDAQLCDSCARQERRERGRALKQKTRKGEVEFEEQKAQTEDENDERKTRTEAEKDEQSMSAESEQEDKRMKTEADKEELMKKTEAENEEQKDRGAEAESERRMKKKEAAVASGDGKEAEEAVGGAEDPTPWNPKLEEIRGLLRMFDSSQFIFRKEFNSLEEAIRSGGGLLDLFSGKRGFARAFVAAGCPWAVCFDIKDGEKQNLLDTQLQSVLLRLLSLGSFVAMAAGPVCSSFSTAITPPWRTKEQPRGRDGLTAVQVAKLDVGHRQLSFILRLVDICLRLDVLFWIENPDGSWFWRMDGELSWERILENPKVQDFRVDQCRLGTPWRKRTRFRTNSHAGGQKLLCSGRHLLLRGKDKLTKQNYTKLAESYPQRLCTLLAGVFAIDAGLVANKRPISISDVVSADHKRIGEAKNPGPRRGNWQRRDLDRRQ